jgi:hypothetical protein
LQRISIINWPSICGSSIVPCMGRHLGLEHSDIGSTASGRGPACFSRTAGRQQTARRLEFAGFNAQRTGRVRSCRARVRKRAGHQAPGNRQPRAV